MSSGRWFVYGLRTVADFWAKTTPGGMLRVQQNWFEFALACAFKLVAPGALMEGLVDNYSCYYFDH